jgi:two-component system, LytTR family, response regulator
MTTNVNTIKAIIVDDEKGARESLSKMVEKYCPQIEVVAKADSMKTALTAINTYHPDLVFLDIEMPNGNAFDLLEKIDSIDFDIIFTTAYDHYAIKAIKFSAIDYILKPIDPEELVQAVDRLKNITNKKATLDNKFKALLSNLIPDNKVKKLALPEGDGFIFVKLSEVIRCESTNHYTMFYLTDKREILSTKNLGDYEQMLCDDNFIRVHRSHLINYEFVKKYIRGEGGYVVMEDDSKIEVSRRAKTELLDRISKP